MLSSHSCRKPYKFVYSFWYEEDLNDKAMNKIDAHLLHENNDIEEKIRFDMLKMKQKLFIPWKLRLENPMIRGR